MSTKLTGYVWDACASSGMKLSSVAIMARLADFSSDEGVSWPSIGTIARQIGAGESTVRTALAQLEKDGWLSRKQRRNGNRNASNVYQLNVVKLREAAFSHLSESDTSNSDASKSDVSKSDPSKSDASKSDPSKSSKKGGFDPSESGGDPSVNSKQEPQVNSKPISPVARQPDQVDSESLVLDHFNRVTNSNYGKGGRTKSTLGYIRGRLAEDYSPEDLMLVVDYLNEKWANDPKMSDYLRPKTLFAPENCVEYFEKAKKWDSAGRPSWMNGKWEREAAGFKSKYECDTRIPDGFRG